MTAVTIAGKLGRVLLVAWIVAMVAWLCSEAFDESARKRAARAAGVLPADDSTLTAELREQLIDDVAKRQGLNRSLVVRLADYSAGMLQLDFGRSWRDSQPIAPRLASATITSLRLLLLALLLGIALGGAAAIASARRPGSAGDTALGIGAAIVLSSPPVWLALLGLRAFGWGATASAVLPVVVLALVPAFVIARHGRAALIEASTSPWAVAARARGVSRSRLVAVHAVRASMAQLLPLISVLTAYLLGAMVVLEELFGISGLGRLLVDASRHGDTPMIVAVSVVCAVVVAFASAALDLTRRRVAPNEGE